MFCRTCGAQNDASAYSCVHCGEVLQYGAPAAPPQTIPNYLVHAILVTVLCCLPFGIASIVYAAQVNSKVQAGDIHGAMEASRKARMWAWLSFGIGLGGTLIYVAFMVLAGASSY